MKKYNSKVDGITYRMYQDDKDYEIFTDLINAYYKHFDIDRVDSANENKQWLEAQKTYDKTKNFTVAEYEGKPVSIHAFFYSKQHEGPYAFSHWFGVEPKWIETPLMGEHFDFVFDDMVEAAKEIEDGAEVIVRNYYEDKEAWFKPFLEERGFKEVRYFFEMSRPAEGDVPERRLADGLEIKPADTDEKVDQVMWAVDKAFEDHFGHTPMTQEMMEAWKKDEDFDPKLWKVAWDGDKVAGNVLNYISKKENAAFNRKRGYTETISTPREYRKKGIASALIAESIKMFQEMGMDEVALGVDAINPSGALGLYESFGYVTYKRSVALDKKIR